ncbi:hypothetical protein pb186bvf_007508 [Paramecium bursaria]
MFLYPLSSLKQILIYTTLIQLKFKKIGVMLLKFLYIYNKICSVYAQLIFFPYIFSCQQTIQ